MADKAIESIGNVTVVCKANVYFDGRVVSHTVLDGDRKRTVGIIYPGSYTFNTDSAERMDIIDGTCRVRVAGAADWTEYSAGSCFRVPAKSSFEIAVADGLGQYLCTFE